MTDATALIVSEAPAADICVDRIAQAPDVGVESRQALRRLTRSGKQPLAPTARQIPAASAAA